MYRNLLPRNFAGLAALSIGALILAVTSIAPAMWGQNSPAQYRPVQQQQQMGQYPPGQFPPGPPGRPQLTAQCQSALADRISADVGRRVNLTLDSQNPYSVSNDQQGIRGRLRYGIGGPNTWRTANYDCLVNVRRNRVDRATYSPRGNGNNWPGGPGYPGGPGSPVVNYPRVRVDTSGRGTFSSRSAGNVKITRGYVDSTGRQVSVSMRGGNFRITFYGVVERSDGQGFTMRITSSDRGDAQGTAQARLNKDRNEVETITLSGRIGRDNFTGNFGR